jgi:hypothetical protein
MVKIKTFNNTTRLTTQPTAPKVNPSEFTGAIKETEKLGEFFVKKAEAFQQVANLSERTKARTNFGRQVLALQDEFAKDTDPATASQRSQQALQVLVEENAKTIGDEKTRQEFLLFAESKALQVQGNIQSTANSSLLQIAKDDYEIQMDDYTDEINKLQSLEKNEEAATLAQEAIMLTADMENKLIIFPDVAAERLKTFEEATSKLGQAQYEIDNMQTNEDMDLVKQRLDANTYKLDKKDLSEKKTEFNKIAKALKGDLSDLNEIDHINNLQAIVTNKELTNAQKIEATRKAVINGEAGLPGGVDPTAGRGVITQLIAQGKTVTDQRTEEQKVKTTPATSAILVSRARLNLDDNGKKTGEKLEEAQENDGKLETIQAHIKFAVSQFEQGNIDIETFGKELDYVAELTNRRFNEEEKLLFEAQRQAVIQTIPKFNLLGIPIGEKEILSKAFIDNPKTGAERRKLSLINAFMDGIYKTTSTQEIRTVLNQYKEGLVGVLAPETINTRGGAPNGVGSADKPIETLADQPSSAEVDKPIKKKKVKNGVVRQLRPDNVIVDVLYEDGVAISEVEIK